jgi:hypothetical protein
MNICPVFSSQLREGAPGKAPPSSTRNLKHVGWGWERAIRAGAGRGKLRVPANDSRPLTDYLGHRDRQALVSLYRYFQWADDMRRQSYQWSNGEAHPRRSNEQRAARSRRALCRLWGDDGRHQFACLRSPLAASGRQSAR